MFTFLHERTTTTMACRRGRLRSTSLDAGGGEPCRGGDRLRTWHGGLSVPTVQQQQQQQQYTTVDYSPCSYEAIVMQPLTSQLTQQRRPHSPITFGPPPNESQQRHMGAYSAAGSSFIGPTSTSAMRLGDEIVTLNISGERFQTYRSTLERFPHSRLGDPCRIALHWDKANGEYFFDRRRNMFESILYIYQSHGRIVRPPRTPLDQFVEEIEYFDLGQEIMETFWESEGFERPKPREAHPGRWRWQGTLWDLMEHADTSAAARCVALFSVFVIVLSITNFCLETMKGLRDALTPADGSAWKNPFHVVETFCIVYFTIEFILRLISCPSVTVFMKHFLNIIDVVSILPFYLNLLMQTDGGGGGAQFAMLRVLRLIRVFRIFKLSRHSVGLQILGKTFAASMQEFVLLCFFLCIALVLFSSGMYFAEQGVINEAGEINFESIPATFWYSLVTMTTIGYGDMVPIGVPGKLIGSACALFGVLTLAMPVPIIVANFKHFYEQEQRLQQLRHIQRQHESPCDDKGLMKTQGPTGECLIKIKPQPPWTLEPEQSISSEGGRLSLHEEPLDLTTFIN